MVQGRQKIPGESCPLPCPSTFLVYVNPQNRLFPSYTVIQVVLYLNPHLTADCSPCWILYVMYIFSKIFSNKNYLT